MIDGACCACQIEARAGYLAMQLANHQPGGLCCGHHDGGKALLQLK